MLKALMVSILLLIWSGGCFFSAYLIALMYQSSNDIMELLLACLMAFIGLLLILLLPLTSGGVKFNKH